MKVICHQKDQVHSGRSSIFFGVPTLDNEEEGYIKGQIQFTADPEIADQFEAGVSYELTFEALETVEEEVTDTSEASDVPVVMRKKKKKRRVVQPEA